MSAGARARRVTLGAWLALASSLLSVLLTFALTLVLERSASEQIGRGIGANLAELANQSATRMDRALFERYRELKLLSQRLAGRTDWTLVQQELTAARDSYRFYGWIGLADASGIVQASSGGRLLGADVHARPWFQRALQGQPFTDVHDAVLLAGTRPANGEAHPRFFQVAFPVLLADGSTGVLAAHVSWAWAADLRAAVFRPLRRDREVDPLIVSADGSVLLGPAGTEGRKLHTPSLQRALAGETGYITEAWPDGSDYLVGYSRTRGYEDSPGLGWAMLVREELDEAYAPVAELRKTLLASGIAFAVFFSLLGWAVAGAITRPLLELERSARIPESGRVAIVEPSRAYREVQSLARSLNTLVQQLESNQAQLRELNAQLEHRVEERTEELRRAFERVRANEQRIQTIIESAQDPYIGVDLEGRIIDWNTQAEVLFGWGREEVIGRPVSETIMPERFSGRIEDALRDFLDTGSSPMVNRPVERTLVDRQGREIPVEVKIGLVSTGSERFFSAFVHDLSQRKEVERMKDEFISTVSHELRTPLTAIYGSLDMLASGMAGELPPDVAALLKISHQSTERLIRLINDMLDVEKIASGKMEYRLARQPLRPLVEHALRDTRPLMQGQGLQVRVAAGEDLVVLADADRIVQVCVNLLSNAAKFSPPGGAIEVEVARAGERARVSVVDHGPGVPPEFRERIFDRFAQADASDRRARGGTGLGLNICRSIVQAHGGEMGYESEPRVRTAFWFELPLAVG